jgi:imidazole glycerol-phosphate synthase subunit HisH
VLFDYGSGNIRSAERALVRAGADVLVTSSVEDAHEAQGVVVPGVGAFAACVESLRAVDGARMVWSRVAAERPLLAICVGHQVLFERGDEHGISTPGLGIWPGAVSTVVASVVPHVGWNTVSCPGGSAMFAGIDDERFYFVHSYAAHTGPPDATGVAWTSYGEDTFVAAVEQGSLWSTQFHPEKSGDAGAALLRSWVTTLG